jgi:hypothetical protein
MSARQAVVVIHGIGEQRPMETLRSFVLGVLGSAVQNKRRIFYSKPDPNADTFELRRYRAFDRNSDTDFIEFYWQHKMPIASWRFLFSWLWLLMNRPSEAMPPRFRILWWVAWIAFTIFAVVTLLGILDWLGVPNASLGHPAKVSSAVALVGASLGFIVRAFVGDAAIYLNPHPRTVEARNAIRTAGVELLERLQRDGRYDRILVVGHSLGSVIGYDILSFAWHRVSERFRLKVEAGQMPDPRPKQPQLTATQKLGRSAKVTSATWKASTRKLLAESRSIGLEWKITDFVTLGSPLAHASLLLARGPQDLIRRIQERELPTAPPFCEDGAHFAFRRPAGPAAQAARVPDHAALFSHTAWTNLYFPCRAFLYGDLVGGSVTEGFGPGVTDQAVQTRKWYGWLAHTNYWTRYEGFEGNASSSPNRLIEALDLDRLTF